MSQRNERVVVEGVDFRELFMFPHVLRSITTSLQPPRLVVGVLMIAALLAVGKLWDSMSDDTVNPGGLTAGKVDAEQLEQRQTVLIDATQRYADERHWPEGDPDRWPRLTVEEYLPPIISGYRYERRDLVESEGGPGVAVIRQSDREFIETIERIDAVRDRGVFEATAGHVVSCVSGLAEAVVYVQPARIVHQLNELFVRMPVTLFHEHRLFLLIYGVFFLFVTAVCGGALSRMTALELAVGERMRIRDAVEFSLSHWLRLMLAPALPLILAGVLILVMGLLGVLMNVPGLDVVGAMLYGVVLILGLIATLLVLLYAAAFHLVIPAVATENCDLWDAQQRSYAYVLNRPLHWLGYGLIGVVGLAIGYVIVAVVAAVLLNMSATLFSALSGNSALTILARVSPFDLQPHLSTSIHGGRMSAIAAWVLGFWQMLVLMLVAAYVVAYYFSASTAAYLLLRKTCDGQDPAEVWQPGLVPGTTVPLTASSFGEAQARPRRAEGWLHRAVGGGLAAAGRLRGRDSGPSRASDRPGDGDEVVELGPELLDDDADANDAGTQESNGDDTRQ